MNTLKILRNYKRFRESSALTNKERNLVEDFRLTEEYLKKNCDDSNCGDYLYTTLLNDALYMTINCATHNRKKFKELTDFNGWSKKDIKEGCRLITTVENARNVGDLDALVVQRERLMQLLARIKDLTATKLYIYQRWYDSTDTLSKWWKDINSLTNKLLDCTTEEEVVSILMEQYEPKQSSSTDEKKSGTLMTPTEVRNYWDRGYYAETVEEIELLLEELESKYFDSGYQVDYYRNAKKSLNNFISKLKNETPTLYPSPSQPKVESWLDEVVMDEASQS